MQNIHNFPQERRQARNPVIELVVAECHRVKVEQIVEPRHHPPLEVRIPDSSLIAGVINLPKVLGQIYEFLA